MRKRLADFRKADTPDRQLRVKIVLLSNTRARISEARTAEVGGETAMDESDRQLQEQIATWLRNSGRSATLEVRRVGGQLTFRLVPSRTGAAFLELGIADEADELRVSVGECAWWTGVPWGPGTVATICDSVADGQFFEEYKSVFGWRVARRGTLRLGVSDALTWALITNPLFSWPGLKWTPRRYQTW